MVLSPGKSAKVSTEHLHLHRIATWHKTYVGIGGQRLLSLLVTLLLHLKEEFPGKQFTAVLQRLAFTPGVQSGASLLLHSTGNTGYCGAENMSWEPHKKEGVFSSLKSRNVPDEVILVETSPGEQMDLAFIPFTRQKLIDLVAKESLCVVE
ncbi:hypothetical protein TNCV_2617991 [Trichonephila clavipes]|nr:hypothetical protein TNCV_2617991 [Trichonephila clavipes]